MDFIPFLKGIILGFSIAAPVGPIGILCIRRTLQFGRFSGFFSGLGAAVADTCYGIIAALGLTCASDFLQVCKPYMHLVGGIFLLYLGTKICMSRATRELPKVSHSSLLSDFISTFFLTIANPMTILSYVAIFAGIGFTGVDGHPFKLVTGIFTGSMIWWLCLSEGVTFFRKKVNHNMMKWINRLAGALILIFGISALIWY